MPRVQSVQITPTMLRVIAGGVTKTLLNTDIPQTQNTAAKIETWVNTWLAANLTECQAVVHVFTVTPLNWTIGCFNLGVVIPSNWWAQ